MYRQMYEKWFATQIASFFASVHLDLGRDTYYDHFQTALLQGLCVCFGGSALSVKPEISRSSKITIADCLKTAASATRPRAREPRTHSEKGLDARGPKVVDLSSWS